MGRLYVDGRRGGELKAQLSVPKVKPGAYHSEGVTVSYRAEGLYSSFTGVTSPNKTRLITGLSLLGFGAGVKIPAPKLRSQIIPTAGLHLGLEFPSANRLELGTEW